MTTFSEQFPIVFQALNIGFVQTLKLFFVTLIGAIPLGLIISFGSMSNWAPLGFLRPLLKNLPKNTKLTWWQRFQIWCYVDFKPIRIIVRFIIWVVRGTPLMLQLLVFYYFPGLVLGKNIWGGGEAGRFLASSIAFIFNYACYFSEIFRGGIQGVPKGQQEAGQVLGMTNRQIFFKVTLLQMVKRIVPPMSNEIITLVKDTSLSRIIALQEIIWAGQAFLKGDMSVLEVRNLKKSFGKDTVVLKGVDFSLEKGETVAIIGSSGSGKTTLLRCLNFLTVPDEGQIVVNDETLFDDADPNTQKEREIRRKRLHFGLVFQNFNLFPQYTARQNVMLASELLAKEQPDYKAQKKLLHAQIAARAEELLTQVGLKEKMDLYPHQLSGGQQQRVAIARALALQPDILCFDEPTSALDPELTGEVLKVIRSLSEQHMTMIIVTHEMAFARDVANRVIFMDGGVIVEQGPARDVIENPQAERTKQFLARYRENQ